MECVAAAAIVVAFVAVASLVECAAAAFVVADGSAVVEPQGLQSLQGCPPAEVNGCL